MTELTITPNAKPIDSLAIVYFISEPQTCNCRDGIPREKQTIRLLGDTLKIVTPTLWAEHVHAMDGLIGSSVSVSNALVRDYNGKKTLTTSPSFAVRKDDTEELQQLKNWWDTVGNEQGFTEITVDV